MISKIKKPVSILLVFMMIVSLFTVVPITASAAEETSTVTWNSFPGNGGMSSGGVTLTTTQGNTRMSNCFYPGRGSATFTAPEGSVFTKIELKNCDYVSSLNFPGATVAQSGGYSKQDPWDDEPTWVPYYTVTWTGESSEVTFSGDFVGIQSIVFTLKSVAPTTYTVTWKNGDTVIETDTDVAKDATPEYNGATPTKDFDGKYYYDFKGWTPEITAVTGDATYTAVFEKADINYGDDNKISQDGTVDVSAADEGAASFGLNLPKYNNMQMLGVQKKSAIPTKEGDNGIRFVTAVNTNLLKGSKIDDYGYIVVKAKAGTDTTKIYDKMNNLTYGAVDENVNVFSCKGKSNTISGDFGLYDADTDYKYITLAITGTDGVDATLAARFYIKTTDGKFYYADYIDGNNATHGGMAFDIASVLNNLV